MSSLRLPLAPASRDDAPFLGVERSARGLKWVERLPPSKAYLGAAISQRHNLPELVGRLLAARGASLEEVPALLNPTVKAFLPDPASLTEMAAAADRIADAVMKGEPIAIFGDYDVDGASASALLYRFLAWHGLDPRIYIPDRQTEGYGPNPAAMAALIEGGAQLIVTVDCGSTSFEALDVPRARGVDVVVVDHHQVNDELPVVTALVNPNRQDDLSGQGHLCAAGVTFLLCVALLRQLRLRGAYKNRKEPDLLGWLDIVALATICDVVPLAGVNRAFVVQGLKVLRHRQNPGLRALCDTAALNAPPTAYHMGFVLGPRINAGGRIGDSALGAKLLATDDPQEAERIAAILDRLNRERREMELRCVEEACGAAERILLDEPQCPLILAGSPDWHKGLVGLVASRLTERFQRPSLVFAHDVVSGMATGSGRSVKGVDIGAAVRAAVEAGHAVKGGGHSMAAGVTVPITALPAFERFMRDALQQSYSVAASAATLAIDGVVTPQGATAELAELLERAGPYGPANPAPRLVVPSARVGFTKVMTGGHIRCALLGNNGAQLAAVSFRGEGTPGGDLLTASGGRPVHVAGRLQRSEWGGRERIEFQIEDVAPL